MPPKVLFLTGSSINFQEDVLHEGLDELLGAEHVYCYPYKDYKNFQYNLYPESANSPRHRNPIGLMRLMEQRESIDAVIIGGNRPDSLATWRVIQDLFTHCPVALLHGGESEPHWPEDIHYTHRFQMDLLPENQAPDLFPLPMAVPPRVMLPEETERDIKVSFVARLTHQIRFQCAELLRQGGFTVFANADLPRELYCWILNRTKIAVSLRGAAFDTFRYWEIPYHGALLLSQRLPILIPDNFVDGQSAVFFDSPEEMMDKIHSLLADEDRLAWIAANGQNLAREKHTSAARARYVLETMGLVP
ncbi:MAG: glycosyltransferase [Firmicutes bacterium]|nr:glycosyltransferase [Bacillota bacterium]